MLVLLNFPDGTDAFLGNYHFQRPSKATIRPPRCPTKTTTVGEGRSLSSLIVLHAANKSSSNSKSKTYIAKPAKASKGRKSAKGAKPAAKGATPSAAVAYQPAKKTNPGTKKSTPPWQVLSTKEAAKNMEKEKTRRSNLKQCIVEEEDSQKDEESRTILSRAFLSEAEGKFLNWKRFNPEKAVQGQRFIGAYLDRNLPPRLGVPEVAFLGRSNVGKSSLLNRLAKSGDMARVGKTPGATASVNLYALLDAQERILLGLADLPGFGYAKLSQVVQESVRRAAEHYLDTRNELALGILLVDVRRDPGEADRAVLAALYDMGVPIVVVATKMDKISSEYERERQLAAIQTGLGLPPGQPLTVSSVTGEGCKELWRILLEACETCVAEVKSKYVEDVVDDDDDDEEEGEERDPWYDFEDSEDLVYDQGFDWIHGSGDAVVYEGGDDNDEFNDDNGGDDFVNDDDDDDAADLYIEPQRETLKSLKKKVKGMQKRGEI